jgi:GNAT acetyltransferase-like protein
VTEFENKSQYRQLCATEPSIPIFSRDWWLDTVCEDVTWDVVLVEKGGNIVGTMPYCIRKRWGLRLLSQPLLTQTLGPWLRPSGAKYAKALAQQKDIMGALIRQLPPFDRFSQNWHYSMTNWLPFHWEGFKQTTLYTYVLSELDDEAKLWSGVQANIRTDIKKASNRYGLRVRDDLDVADFLILSRMTFSRQALEQPFSDSLVHRLDAACAARGCRRILIAEDAEGHQHAGVYIIWDENSAYYLLGGGDPEFRNSGATSLCIWEAIKHAATVTKRFDFEGSIIEPIERFFRAFGAIQTPYFQITKTPSRLLRARQAFSSLIKSH